MIEKAVSQRQTQKKNTKTSQKEKQKWQVNRKNPNEYIVQAVAKGAARAENVGAKMSGPIMKQTTFDWSTKDKYAKLGNFKLEVKTCSKTLI